MQLTVGTSPAGQHAGRRIVERLDVRRAQPISSRRVTVGIRGLAELTGHRLHAPQRAIGQCIGIRILVAEPNAVPPVGRAFLRLPRPRARVPTVRVFQQAVRVLIHGQEHLGPPPQSVIPRRKPRLILASHDIVEGGNQQRRITVQIGRILGRSARHVESDVARQAVSRHPVQVSIERLPHEIQGCQILRQGRRVESNIGILVQTERTRVARGMISQDAQTRIPLKDVQPVSPKPREPSHRFRSLPNAGGLPRFPTRTRPPGGPSSLPEM